MWEVQGCVNIEQSNKGDVHKRRHQSRRRGGFPKDDLS